jgi:transcriptional regulator with XRE-family HTH domain
MAGGANNSQLTNEVAKRLTLARKAYGFDQREFGERAGLSQPQYNQFETGRRLLTLAAAMMLCDEYNLTLDWIYRGEPSNLPRDLWLKIRTVEKTL